MTAQLDAHVNRQLQETSGLSRPDYNVLVPLSESPEGRLRMYEIAQAACWEQSRLSHHLGRMQNRGLIAREDCPTDRRGAFVALTAAGREAIEAAAPAHVATVREALFVGLDRGQVRALGDIAAQVLARLDAIGAADAIGGCRPPAPPARRGAASG